jgi:hypothetical protein
MLWNKKLFCHINILLDITCINYWNIRNIKVGKKKIMLHKDSKQEVYDISSQCII